MSYKMTHYRYTTQVPNFIFDIIPHLTESELKLLLTIVRQTLGWLDKRTGNRKIKDRITGSQFRLKTGLSKRIINKATKSLITKGLIEVTGTKGIILHDAKDRRGVIFLHYGLSPMHLASLAGDQNVPKPVNRSDHNKTNYIKPTRTKLRRTRNGHIGSLLPTLQSLLTTRS
jgi:hypothetical protein